MKRFTLLLPAVLSVVVVSSAFATANDPALLRTLRQTERIVNSLQLNKPSQMRVFAFDGTEYTGAEAVWLKNHLRAAQNALANSDSKMAAQQLQAVVSTLKSHGAALDAPQMASR